MWIIFAEAKMYVGFLHPKCPRQAEQKCGEAAENMV